MPPSLSKPAVTSSSHATLREALKPRKPSSPDRRLPVIVQMEPARIIHAQPQEFRRLVQLLTGKQQLTEAAQDDSSSSPASSPALPCSHLLIDINVAYEGGDEESRWCE